eukprot:tig00020553_g10663.t1
MSRSNTPTAHINLPDEQPTYQVHHPRTPGRERGSTPRAGVAQEMAAKADTFSPAVDETSDRQDALGRQIERRAVGQPTAAVPAHSEGEQHPTREEMEALGITQVAEPGHFRDESAQEEELRAAVSQVSVNGHAPQIVPAEAPAIELEPEPVAPRPDKLMDGFSCTSFLQRVFSCFSPLKRRSAGLPESEGPTYLLSPIRPEDAGRKTLVLDLDESLVHSSFQPTAEPDIVLPFAVGDHVYTMYVGKRPGVDEFLRRMGELYEVVIFTASLSKYADPLLDKLDKHKVIRARLFRDACITLRGCYVKDLTRLGRPLKNTIIVDNSPASYVLQPQNAVPVTSWFGSTEDRELYDLIPFLEQAAHADDVIEFLARRSAKLS